MLGTLLWHVTMVAIYLAIPQYAQAREIRQLQNQIDFLNCLVNISNKLRIFPGGFESLRVWEHESFRENNVRVSDWRIKQKICVVNIAILKYAETWKIRQLQSQNTFLNCLTVLNKYKTVPKRFGPNPLKISDCREFSLETDPCPAVGQKQKWRKNCSTLGMFRLVD